MKSLLTLLITLLIIPSVYTTASSQNRVVLHHSHWAPLSLPANGTFNWTGITHLIIFGMEPHSGLPGSYYLSIHGAYNLAWGQAITAEAKSHGVKVLLCTGGIARGSDLRNNIAPNPTFRRTVVNAHVNYAINILGADGIDLDWEHDVDGALWTALSRDYREALDAAGPGKILAADIGRFPSNAWPIAAINQYYDFVSPMLYDANGWYSTTTGFHNALGNPQLDFPTIGYEGPALCADACMKAFEAAGVIKSKVCLGLSFYPHVFHHLNPVVDRPGLPMYGSGNSCNLGSGCEGMGDFNHDVYPKILAGATVNYAPNAASAWIGSQSQNYFLNYLDARSFVAFEDYVRVNNWGGVMLFANEHQYFLSPIEWPIGSGTMTRTPLLDDFRRALAPPTPSAPLFSLHPVNRTVLVGEQASFTVQVAGYPTPTYQWQRNGINISGATNVSYAIPVTVVGDNGATFRCVATNSQGAATSTSATLTVSVPTSSAPSFLVQPVNRTVLVGEQALFTVQVAGYPTPTYQWQRNDVNISGATGSTYTTPVSVIGDNGATFRCIATNSQGAATSTNATLTISTPSVANPTSDDFSNTARFTNLWSKSHPGLTSLVGQGTTDAFLRLNLDGTAHEMGNNDYGAVRVLQDITNGNFEVVAKYQTLPSATYQWEGVLVKENAARFLRFDIIKDNGGLKFYAGMVSASSQQKILTAITLSGPSAWVKVNRTGNVWTAWYSSDGSAYAQAGQFTQSMVVDSIGVYAGNQNGGSGVPAFDCKVDYFFNVTSPINPEDPVTGAPTGSLGVSNDSLPSGGGNVTLTWTSSAAVSASIDQGVGSVALNGSTTVAVAQSKSFTITLTNAIGSQSYVAQVFVAPQAGAPTGSLNVSSDSLPAGGGNITLTWTSNAALSASIDQGIGNVAINGSTTVAVGQTKSFTLTLTNAVGSQSYVASVVVALPGGNGSLQDITSTGYPVAFITNPTGSGNTNLEIIRDGITPPQGSSNPNEQYDTYNGGGTRLIDWIGYTYSSTQSFGSLIFQEGIHAPEGGFFSGNPRVEIRVGAQWIEAPGLTIAPAYGAGSAPNFTRYTLIFNAISGDGIRVVGSPGGSSRYLSVAELRVMGIASGTVSPDNRPKDFYLLSNYPNPFNPSTTIEFWVPATSHVTLSVYNILGQKVRTLVDQAMNHGKWPVTWDGRDDQNRLMSSGIYIYKMQAGDFVATRKMILSK